MPKRSLKPVWFAIAATVVLATSISVRMSGVFESNYSLADDVLAHIDHEPGSLRATNAVVCCHDAVGASGASFAGDVRPRRVRVITYAQPCVINGNLTCRTWLSRGSTARSRFC